VSPTFLERVQSYDGTGLTGGVERMKERALRAQIQGETPIPEHAVLREATAAERKLIGAIRKAFKEYDRTVKPDGRRLNGTKRVDPKALAKGVKLIRSGMSIRRASAVTGVSYTTLWYAKSK
jgi:hypothetical protein